MNIERITHANRPFCLRRDGLGGLAVRRDELQARARGEAALRLLRWGRRGLAALRAQR